MTAADLLPLLQTEAQALTALLQAMDELQQSLIKGSAEAIRVRALSCDNRRKALENAAQERQETQTAQHNLSLSQWIENTSDLRLRVRLQAVQKELLEKVNVLRKKQHQNQALIAQGQALTEETLQMLIHLQQQGQPAVYGRQGQEASQWEQERSICDFNA